MDSNRRRSGTIVDLIPVNTPLAQFPAALDTFKVEIGKSSTTTTPSPDRQTMLLS